jgi:hypothetical protein
MNDDEMITAVREQRDRVHSGTTVDQVISRGRTVRARRRVTGAVSGLAVVTAASVALGLGAARAPGTAPASTTGTTRTVAFILARNANGTDTLTINPRVLLDPRTLENDLARYGIPAKVTAGSFCSTQPAPARSSQVLTFSAGARLAPGPAGTDRWVRPGPPQDWTVTINPAAIPRGTEISFGAFQLATGQETAFTLIDPGSYTCTSTPPARGSRIMAIVSTGKQ